MADFSNRSLKLFVHVFIVILSAIVFYVPLKMLRARGKERGVLFIAIPSGPDHTDQRKSLRETWLQLVPDKSYNYKFIVGKHLCNIHPYDRKSEYSCESLNISLPKDVTEKTLLHVNSLETNNHKVQNGLGFIFMVHHPVIIQSLGIGQATLIPGSGQIARVVLHFMPQNNFNVTDSVTKLLSTTFHSDSAFGDANNKRYVYKKLSNPVHLPKGFEGLIIVEKVDGFNQEGNCTQSTHWEHGNLFTILNVITTDSIVVNANNFCIWPSFGFTIKEITELEKHINRSGERNLEWRKHVKEVHRQLQSEADQHNDILFLDVIDVYRNLPQKMFLFLKWLFDNFDVDYVLKTDDDSFVDILKIQEELEKPSNWDWWSCFRIDWPVMRSGKWRETFDYKEETYPPFPTGAGYVLSERALQWLKKRLDTLSVAYQGEDVAMGIWLQGMAPSRHAGEVCYWACVEPPACHPRSCNVMQLSVAGVYETWRQYRNCGNRLCDCATDPAKPIPVPGIIVLVLSVWTFNEQCGGKGP